MCACTSACMPKSPWSFQFKLAVSSRARPNFTVRALRPYRELVEFCIETGLDVARGTLLPGITKLFVARDVRITIKNADWDRIRQRSDLARPVDIRRIVPFLGLVDLGQVRAECHAVFMSQQQGLERIVHPRIE